MTGGTEIYFYLYLKPKDKKIIASFILKFKIMNQFIENFSEEKYIFKMNFDNNDSAGRKRTLNPEMWARNLVKQARNSGMPYISTSGEEVPEKIFEPVVECCKRIKCYQKISVIEQENCFNEFWGHGDYGIQNLFLSHLLKYKESVNVKGFHKKRLVNWKYLFSKKDCYEVICQVFLIGVLQITQDRISTVQDKMRFNESLFDMRGKYGHCKVLDSHLMKLIQMHCELTPHQKSHYRREETKLNYFEDSSLNYKILYLDFLEFYRIVEGDDEPPISLATYGTYFNFHVNFSFSRPRSDVCNFCYEVNKQNDFENIEYINHIEECRSYKNLKQQYLAEETNLCLEFDFAQNLPLPKLPVNQQYYSRLLWLFIFNVHIFDKSKKQADNSDKENSYMFMMLEGLAKKGSNTVINFVLFSILKEFNPEKHKKIILFSDSCGGQNKNYLFLQFFTSLAQQLGIVIEHVFPVVGHSYNQCDRNFGLYSKKKKNLETIETAEEYADLIANSRNSPFTIVQENEYELIDYEEIFPALSQKKQRQLKISKQRRLLYQSNGEISTFYKYNGEAAKHQLDIINLESAEKKK